MYSLTDICLYFMFYAVIGWCIEVIYATVNKGIFVNRGFLNGPLCPIYGIGATIVIICLTPLNDNFLLLFIGSFLLTSILEFLTGLILELIFNQKWWDYTNQPFNIKGYVCLKFSLMWGLACVFVMRIVQPFINKMILKVPDKITVIIIITFFATLFVDITITVIALSKLHLHIRLVNELDKMLTSVSDSIGSKISEHTLESMEHIHEVKIGYVGKRLEKAFPALDFSRFKKVREKLESIKEEIKKEIKK